MALTAGRRALLAVLQRTSARNVAARCGVTPQAVSQWASGRSRPTGPRLTALWVNYGISPESWNEAYRSTRRLIG